MTAWNPANKAASITLTGSNLIATKTGSSDALVIADTGYSAGKRVYAVIMNVVSDASPAASRAVSATNQYPGDNATSLGVIPGTGIYYNGVVTTPAPTVANGNTVFIAVDFTNSRLWWRVGTGGQWNGSGAADPDTNVGGFNMSTFQNAGALFPAAGFATAGGQATLDPTAAGHGLTTFTPWDSAGTPVSVTDVSATGAVGTTTVTGKATVSPTNVSTTGAVGTVVVTGSLPTSGWGTGPWGMGPWGAGTAVPILVTSVSATGALGTVAVTVPQFAPVTGVSATGAVGFVSIVSGLMIDLTGVQATGVIGNVQINLGIYVSGVTAEGATGSVMVWGETPNVPPGGNWVPVAGGGSGGWSQVSTGAAPNWIDVVTS